MPRTCTICARDDRGAIDAALASGATLDGVAASFKVNRNAAYRHKSKCLTAKLAIAAAESEQKLDAASLLDQMQDIHGKTLTLLDYAIESKAKVGDISRTIREARENLRLMGQLIGAFPRDGNVTNIIDNRSQTINMLEQNSSVDDLLAFIASQKAALR